MSLDAVTIVGLILGIVGLWGLPTLWTRALYASKVPRQRAKFNARITRQLDDLHDRASGNLRGVDGFEGQVEGIERRYRECYVEMICAHSAIQWLMWVVWCFRDDPYLSKLVALEKELTSLLDRIEGHNGLRNILTAAVNTSERAADTPGSSRAQPNKNSATIISIGGISRNLHVHQTHERFQSANSSSPAPPDSTYTMPPPLNQETHNDCADSSVSSGLDHILSRHSGAHVTENSYGNQNGPLPVPPALSVLPTSPPFTNYGYSRSLNNRNVAEFSTIQLPAGTELHTDSCPLPSKPNPSRRPRSRNARDREHNQFLHSTTTPQQSNSGGTGGNLPASRPKIGLPVEPVTIGSSRAPVSRKISRVTVSASTDLTSSETFIADTPLPSPSSIQQHAVHDTQVQQPPGIPRSYDFPPAATDAYRALTTLDRALTAHARAYADAHKTFTVFSGTNTLTDPVLADALTSRDLDDDDKLLRANALTILAEVARTFAADADAARAVADAANAVVALVNIGDVEITGDKTPESKAAAPEVEMDKTPERTLIRAKL